MTSKVGRQHRKLTKVQERSNTDHDRIRIYVAKVTFQCRRVGIRTKGDVSQSQL